MLIKRQLQGIPTAQAEAGGSMTITRTLDGVLVESTITDTEGFATRSVNGSPGPIRTTFVKGNTWADDSRSIMPVGSMDLCELRNIIDFLHGDGVIIGYGNTFSIVSSGSGSVRINTGAAVLDGVLAVFPFAENVTIANGTDMAIVIKQHDTNGLTGLVGITYSSIGSTTCVPLWHLSISGGAIAGVPQWIGTPILSNGIVHRHPTVMSITRVTSGSTTNASGEDADLETAIALTSGVVYDVEANASVISRARQGAIALKIDGTLGTYQSNGDDRTVKLSNSDSKQVTGAGTHLVQVFDKRETALTTWTLQGSFGSYGSGTSPNFNNPGQVAVDTSGNVYIADTGNSRLVKLNSSGAFVAQATGIPGISAVAVTGSDVYVNRNSAGLHQAIEQYDTDLNQIRESVGQNRTFMHFATDGTNLYATTTANTVQKRVLSAMPTVTIEWGGTGSGAGKFNPIYGIAYSLSQLLVVDEGNRRVQVFDTSGSLLGFTFAIPAGGRGIAVASDATRWVAFGALNQLLNYTSAGTLLDTISQSSPSGLAIATGDVIWTSDTASHAIAKWDEQVAFNWDSGLLVVKAVPRT